MGFARAKSLEAPRYCALETSSEGVPADRFLTSREAWSHTGLKGDWLVVVGPEPQPVGAHSAAASWSSGSRVESGSVAVPSNQSTTLLCHCCGGIHKGHHLLLKITLEIFSYCFTATSFSILDYYTFARFSASIAKIMVMWYMGNSSQLLFLRRNIYLLLYVIRRYLCIHS